MKYFYETKLEAVKTEFGEKVKIIIIAMNLMILVN